MPSKEAEVSNPSISDSFDDMSTGGVDIRAHGRSQFFSMPNELARGRIGNNAFRVLALLLSHEGNFLASMTKSQLQKQSNLGRAAFDGGLAELSALGIVTQRSRKNRLNYITYWFSLNRDAMWRAAKRDPACSDQHQRVQISTVIASRSAPSSRLDQHNTEEYLEEYLEEDGSTVVCEPTVVAVAPFASQEDRTPNPTRSTLRPKRTTPPAPPSPDELKVFEFWKTATKKTDRTEFSPKRQKLIAARLAEYGLDDCLSAVKGCVEDPWHAERDKNEIEYVFRDVEHFEKMRSLAKKRPSTVPTMLRLNPDWVPVPQHVIDAWADDNPEPAGWKRILGSGGLRSDNVRYMQAHGGWLP